METLSNLFKKSDVFKAEFDKIFPARPFNKVNILSYISVCAEVVLMETRKKYPENHLKFINPAFIVDDELFPVGNLPGDPTVARLTHLFFELVQEKVILPVSIPVRDNLLSGICLFYGDTYGKEDYSLFKCFNLDDIFTDVPILANEIHDIYSADTLNGLPIGVAQITSDAFLSFSSRLGISDDEDRVRLIKSLILFRSIAKTIGRPLVFSFVNKFNPRRTFFDCLLSFVSEAPFDEDTLLDFGHIAEAITLPLANYDYTMSKGITSKTMSKRNSLKTIMVKSFKRV